MNLCEREPEIPVPRVEAQLNGGNPFVYANAFKIELENHRDTAMEGEVTLKAFGSQTQTNPPEEQIDGNEFEISAETLPEIGIAELELKLAAYEKTYKMAFFAPKKDATITTEQNGALLTVCNGRIKFCTDSEYAHVCHSLTDTATGKEWLFSRYPSREAFAWWNPFFGGIRLWPGINNNAILKEKISAHFTNATDCFGNEWHGICTRLQMTEDEERKGALYETYFVTLPGLPIFCTFFKLYNGTGIFHNRELTLDMFFNISGNFENIRVELANKRHEKLLLPLGKLEQESYFENVVKIYEKESNEKLYVFHNNRNNGKVNNMDSDNKYPARVNIEMNAVAAPGETFVSSPTFLIISELELANGELDGLERVQFT